MDFLNQTPLRNRSLPGVLAGLLGLLAAGQLHAAQPLAGQCELYQPQGAPRVGLALGGGGARGYAHVGVIKALEELRVPYYYIAGTSMGSIVGGLAATGMDSAELATVVEEADWDDLFNDATPREDVPVRRKTDDYIGLYGPKFGVGSDTSLLPGGLVAGQKILFLFESLTSQRVQVENFDQLPVPFRAVATDIANGDVVVLDHGSLSWAMRASMSVPAAFDPVPWEGRLLVDGGLVRNLPVDVVRGMGAEVVIAVDVGTPLRTAEQIRNVLNIVEQMSGLAIVANSRAQIESLTERDVLVRPQLGNEITSASFDRFGEAWPIGYETVMAQKAQFEPLALSVEDYQRWQESLKRCISGPPVIQFVRIENHSRFADEVIHPLITIEPGSTLDVEQLDYDIRQIYGLGFIDYASYRLVREGGRDGIVVEVKQDERGTDFIETGLSIAGGGRGTTISLQGAYLKTDLDPYGSELRGMAQIGDEFGLLAEVYKVLGSQRRYFVSPNLFASRRNLFIYNPAGQAVAETEIKEGGGQFQFGREFARHARMGLSLNRYFGSVDVTVGPPEAGANFDGGEWSVFANYDRLDDLYLPTRGSWFRVEYLESEEWLGADSDYEQVRFQALHSQSWDRHNLMLLGKFNTTLGSDAPIYSLLFGGGFLNMSGFESNEIYGQHFGMVGAGYRYKLFGGGLAPGYAGTTLEYGNAAQDSSDVFGEGILNGSLYFGYDTPLGPLYLGWGWNEDRSGVLFMRLGAILGSDSIGRR